VPHKPERPFVPHRTPKTARATTRASEFRLYRPFFPDAQRETIESIPSMSGSSVVDAQSTPPAPIRSIEEFLDASPTRAITYAQERSASLHAADDRPEQLPPVEHFLDPLPVVEHFAPDAEGALSDAWPGAGGEAAAGGSQHVELQESGWLETDWQNFDWRAAAALGEGPDADASRAWATTDWDAIAPPARESGQTAAQAIATALDQIAQRIREGELTVPGSGAIADPSKIAATLAALLGVKH
jgi:hypothetical protein